MRDHGSASVAITAPPITGLFTFTQGEPEYIYTKPKVLDWVSMYSIQRC